MVFGQMNEPPGNRLRGRAERPHHGGALPRRRARHPVLRRHIYRFTLAGVEVSALLGRMPSAVGYQPTLAEEMGRLQERITRPRPARSPRCRRSTCLRRPYRSLARDDLRSPRRDRGALARHCLARIYPAVDPLDSTSRQVDPNVIGEDHYNTTRAVQATLQATRSCATHRHSRHGRAFAEDKLAVSRARQDPALPVATFTVARTLPARPASTSRSRTRSRAQDDRQRRVRRAARAGVLYGRRYRRSLREGQGAEVNGQRHHPRRRRQRREAIYSGEAEFVSCLARPASSAFIRATRRSSPACVRARCASSRPVAVKSS